MIHINSIYIGVNGKSNNSELNFTFVTSISSIVNFEIFSEIGGKGGKFILIILLLTLNRCLHPYLNLV